VDLYVLERAFASTHPASEGLYAGVSSMRLNVVIKLMVRYWKRMLKGSVRRNGYRLNLN
jgi:tRNA A-37 threonylcarbamoyl transferase component Bud32